MIRSLVLVAVCWFANPTVVVAAERLPADCRWSVRLDVPALAASRLGGWLDGLAAQAPWPARLKILELATGFSPRRDLLAVTLCGRDAGEEGRLVLLRGSFDPVRLGILVVALPGYASESCDGSSLHSWADGAQRRAACLVAPDLLILGPSPERVRLAILAQRQLADDAAAAGPLLARFSASDLAGWTNDEVRSSPFGGITRLDLRLGTLGDALELTAAATAGTAESAQAIVDLGSQLLANGHRLPALDEALRSARLVGEGDQLSLHLLLSADGLEQVLAHFRRPGPPPAGPPPAAF